MIGMEEKRVAESRKKGVLSTPKLWGCRRSPCLLRLRSATSLGTPAASRRRRFTRLSATIHSRSQSEGTFRPALAVSAQAEGSCWRRLRPAPPLAPPGGQAKGRGWGRWRRAGAWLGRIRTEGAAARRLTQCRCPGAVVTAPHLLGGCPRQGPASVVSAAAQVSPRPPPLKVRGCTVPESRALCLRWGGSTPAQQSSSLRRAWWGRGAGGGGADRCRAPMLPFPPAPATSPPPPRRTNPVGQARRSERELQLSRDFGWGWQTSASSCCARPADCAVAGRGPDGRRVCDGGLRLLPRSDGARATPASLAVIRARPGAPAGVHTSANRSRENSNAAVSEGAVRDAAVGDCIWPGSPSRV